MKLTFDHLAVTSGTLREGAEWCEAALGVGFLPGGKHAAMGTHNRLAGMGSAYFEVIAIDPAAPGPGRPRWFDMDAAPPEPRLGNWIVACDDLDAALALAPPGTGVPMALTRGDLAWSMAVPDDGKLPFDGCFPALISWHGGLHPAARLPDLGLRMVALEVTHPDAAGLRAALDAFEIDLDLSVQNGPRPKLVAVIDTPEGRVRLS